MSLYSPTTTDVPACWMDRLEAIMKLVSKDEDFRADSTSELRLRLQTLREGMNIAVKMIAALDNSGLDGAEDSVRLLFIRLGLLTHHYIQVEWWLHSRSDPHGLAPVASLDDFRKRKEEPPCPKSS